MIAYTSWESPSAAVYTPNSLPTEYVGSILHDYVNQTFRVALAHGGRTIVHAVYASLELAQQEMDSAYDTHKRSQSTTIRREEQREAYKAGFAQAMVGLEQLRIGGWLRSDETISQCFDEWYQQYN